MEGRERMVRDMSTAEKIMDVAQGMVQTRGYHAFSYRDIAKQVGIKTASIHYYYPVKADLARALLQRVRSMFEKGLADIDAEGGNAETRLRKLIGIFLDTYGEDGRLCPFCMIATSQGTLPDSVQNEVRAFWIKSEEWLQDVLEKGQQSGELTLPGSAQLISRMMVSSLEGTMVVAKAFDDRSRLESIAEFILLLVKSDKTF